MVPDDGTDAATAMATVNPKMVVTSNMLAAVTPMFIDDASAVAVMPGENMPFEFVSWHAAQSMVVTSGATFAVVKASIGANQEVVPISAAVSYVTCGPFGCQAGEAPPEISIADSPECQGWDPGLTLEVGQVDNDRARRSGVFGFKDGYDLGWVYSSSLAFDATHDFGTFSDRGVTKDHAKGTNKAMTMANIGEAIVADDNATRDGIQEPCLTYTGNQSDDILKPHGCFRLTTKEDFLSDYTVTLTPQGGDVSWGKVSNWENDPFADLTCDAVTFRATDQIDACALFEAEVDHATSTARIEGEPAFGTLWVSRLHLNGRGVRYITLPYDEDGKRNNYQDPDTTVDDAYDPSFGGGGHERRGRLSPGAVLPG